MPISYSEAARTFKLDTATSTYLISVYQEGYLLNLYYGAKIPESYVPGREILPPSASFSAYSPASGFSPDVAPIEYGTFGAGDMRIAALAVHNRDGNRVTDIRYTGHKIYAGKPPIPGQPSSLRKTTAKPIPLKFTPRMP